LNCLSPGSSPKFCLLSLFLHISLTSSISRFNTRRRRMLHSSRRKTQERAFSLTSSQFSFIHSLLSGQNSTLPQQCSRSFQLTNKPSICPLFFYYSFFLSSSLFHHQPTHIKQTSSSPTNHPDATLFVTVCVYMCLCTQSDSRD